MTHFFGPQSVLMPGNHLTSPIYTWSDETHHDELTLAMDFDPIRLHLDRSRTLVLAFAHHVRASQTLEGLKHEHVSRLVSFKMIFDNVLDQYHGGMLPREVVFSGGAPNLTSIALKGISPL